MSRPALAIMLATMWVPSILGCRDTPINPAESAVVSTSEQQRELNLKSTSARGVFPDQVVEVRGPSGTTSVGRFHGGFSMKLDGTATGTLRVLSGDESFVLTLINGSRRCPGGNDLLVFRGTLRLLRQRGGETESRVQVLAEVPIETGEPIAWRVLDNSNTRAGFLASGEVTLTEPPCGQ